MTTRSTAWAVHLDVAVPKPLTDDQVDLVIEAMPAEYGASLTPGQRAFGATLNISRPTIADATAAARWRYGPSSRP